MMKDYTEIKEEIAKLIEEGKKLCNCLVQQDDDFVCKDLQYFCDHYEVWYTKSLAIIKQLTPDRIQDFTVLYRSDKRKTINTSTYRIADALQDMEKPFETFGPWTAQSLVCQQCDMLSAALSTFDSKVFDIQVLLQADIFDSEIDAAKHLLKRGFLRASGAICGVIIEKHLSEVCSNHNISIKKKNPTIADLNDALKDAVYDTIEWRRMQRLGDLRNLCDHNKDRDPTKDEVEELISGTKRITETIF